MSENPRHVRVAKALGCLALEKENMPGPGTYWTCECKDHAHGEPMTDEDGTWRSGLVARYDLDWAATGPLIERLGISVTMDDDDASSVGWLAGTFEYICGSDGYHAYMDDGYATGETPLIAVCNLILALHAGKLATPSDSAA